MAVSEKKTYPAGIAPVVSSAPAAFEDVDLVPGTEYMGDSLRGHEQVHGKGKNSVALVPQPSQDPHDPLVRLPSRFIDLDLDELSKLTFQNWTRLWKWSTVFASLAYSFLGGWVSLSLNPFFITLMTYFDRSADDIAWLVGAIRALFCDLPSD